MFFADFSFRDYFRDSSDFSNKLELVYGQILCISPNINSLMTTNDIVLVQEHWYMASELYNLENMLNDVRVIGISGMDESVLLQGRPHGGCAIIYNTRLKCSVVPIQLDSKRCMAAIISLHESKLLLINVYMPCDQNQYDAVYDDVLYDINMLIQTHSIDHILIGGDLNTDITRQLSAHTVALG